MNLQTTRPATSDINSAAELRDRGIEIAAENNPTLLEKARIAAREIALERGEVTSDDVFQRMYLRGEHPELLGNAAGSVFRGSEWNWTGKVVPSERINARCRLIRIWRLRSA